MSRLPRRSSITHTALLLGTVAVLLGALTWPLLFTYSGFVGDWDHHLWLLWHQSLSIQANGSPSFFLNSSYSVFYPLYAFYGGTLYTIGGLLSLALGGAPVSAYVLVYILDFAAAFGGWYWLGRMAGLGRWAAIPPGLVFVTSTYYLVVIYIQGDWPGFTGVSMIPLMVAAGLSVLRAQRLRVGAALALALSTVLFFGSHNITILLGLTTLALTSLVVLVCIPDARRMVTPRGVARVAGIVVPSALVSAWYLLPALAYDSSTRIGSEYTQSRGALKTTTWLVSMSHLFTFSRSNGPGLPAPYYLALSLPVLAIVWVVVGLLMLPWGSNGGAWARLLLIFSALAILICVVMTHAGLLLALPRPYTLIQFSYRLETYVLLELCGAILAGLVLARARKRRMRVWMWTVLPVCAVSLGGAIQQLSSLPYPGQDRYTTLAYYGEVETGNNRDFQDVAEPVIPGGSLAAVTIPPEAIHDDRVSFTTSVPAGTLVATNIGAGPSLLHITGATAAGVDSQTGDMVLRVGAPGSRSGADGPRANEPRTTNAATASERISVSTANSLPIALGRALTLVALIALATELLLPAARRLLSRRHSNPRHQPESL